MQKKIDEFLKDVKTVAIAGHVNPDGDCIGSCMGMYLYLRDNFPRIQADVYLEAPRRAFYVIRDLDKAKQECVEYPCDLLILLDISSHDRIGVAGCLLKSAKRVLCLDHHKTNRDTYTWLFNYPEISSTCEVVWNFLDSDKISEKCAEALYMGMVHDTGVFQYASTSPRTMRIAASLMEKGIPFSRLIDETYYQKTYVQNQLLGRALVESFLMFDGKLIVSCIRKKDMDFYHATPADMDGIVSQMRNTSGVEVSVFMYELAEGTWKVSLRSVDQVDVSVVAQIFGGGGHARAAGVTMQGSCYDVINNLTQHLEKDLLK
ncbi:MAG: bifunctional oligoribonuclease/PAP phosphatase NrnA [Bilifractor sp.]